MKDISIYGISTNPEATFTADNLIGDRYAETHFCHAMSAVGSLMSFAADVENEIRCYGAAHYHENWQWCYISMTEEDIKEHFVVDNNNCMLYMLDQEWPWMTTEDFMRTVEPGKRYYVVGCVDALQK